MADSHSHAQFLNPWVLHLQKLGLELKCSFCLNLYNKPLLLPCNHIFCSSCVPKSHLLGSECLLCKHPYEKEDLRQAPYMENVTNIYRSLEASFSTHMLNSDIGRVSEQSPFSGKSNFPDQLVKGAVDTSPPGNSTSWPLNVSVIGTKRVQASNNSSATAKVENGSHFVNSGLRNGVVGQDFQTFDSNMSSMAHPHTRAAQQEHEAVDVYVNQADLSPDTPSSGVSKGVEIDGHGPGNSDDIAKNCSKKSAKRNVNDFGAHGIDECHNLHLKKQKQLNHGLPNMHDGRSPLHISTNLQNPVSTSSNMDAKSGSSSGEQLAVESDSTSLVNFLCAFCQTWKITEGSGPMQHFANGNQVFGNDAGRHNVIHVHRSCIDWAPQIFYESDTVIKNLDKELARAAKLKCTVCGLKGAALGCYAKSCRRSYHVPCAYGIEECRWDSDEFLMLCPCHSSHKFPSERFRKAAPKKCTTSAQIYEEHQSSQHSDFWASSPTGAKNWVLCGSALCADEKVMLVKFAKLCGATVTKAWNPNVTHVIAATNANGACSRTLKVLMAILKGRWILKTDWIDACMLLNRPMDEEPYEISRDNHGHCDGPKTGRLRALNNAPQLFSSLKFFFSGHFVSTYKKDIQDLITAAGGIILDSRDQLQQSCSAQPNPSTLVIYNNDAQVGTEDTSEVLQRQVEAERVAAESGSQVIAHTWILDSIASGTLQSFA